MSADTQRISGCPAPNPMIRCVSGDTLPVEGVPMPEDFKYDVFLCHSPKDIAIVRALAERLKKDGLRVWFDESEPNQRIPLSREGEGTGVRAKTESALASSRTLLLCLSSHALSPADWPALESQTLHFRDPLFEITGGPK